MCTYWNPTILGRFFIRLLLKHPHIAGKQYTVLNIIPNNKGNYFLERMKFYLVWCVSSENDDFLLFFIYYLN